MTPQANTRGVDPDVARTVQVLGGHSLHELRVNDVLEVHDLLMRGRLVSSVPIMRSNIEALIGISLRTLQRREGKSDPLDAEQSSRVWQFADILGRVEDHMGGREAVEDHLTRIEYGVYT